MKFTDLHDEWMKSYRLIFPARKNYLSSKELVIGFGKIEYPEEFFDVCSGSSSLVSQFKSRMGLFSKFSSG